jgi:Nucleotidyl transferase AbiEii toxin, Type IV TA system
MFERAHHQRIAQVLRALNATLLLENRCLFGGGTAIALRHGEYRESIDIDFLISDRACYRNLRQLLTGSEGVGAILAAGTKSFVQARELRADQYGIRTALLVENQAVKFEIVLESRFELSAPASGDAVCGIATLTLQDMATSKLVANSDRWADDGVFSRDLIDLAMLSLPANQLRQAAAKAENAYGQSIREDVEKAVERMRTRHGWLERCMQTMAITIPRAALWQKIRNLQRRLAR